MKISILIITFLMAAIGFGSWILLPLVLTEKNEIPLADIIGFVVDSEENIFIGSQFYGRIQVYNENGEFLRNWKVDALEGAFNISLSEKNNILITTARGREQIEYDLFGNILSRKEIGSYENEPKNENTFTAESGITYQLKGKVINKLIRTEPEKIVIKQNVLLQILNPMKSIFLIIIGSLLVFLLKRRKHDTVYN